jgi:hypothetical protein
LSVLSAAPTVPPPAARQPIVPLTEEGPYQASVTFAGRDEVASHLRDNVWETAKALLEGRPERVAQDRLLDHVGRRFRFSRVLGRAAPPEAAGSALAGGAGGSSPQNETDPGTTELVQSAVRAIRHVVDSETPAVMGAVGELEARVRRSPISERIVDALLSAIEDRFGLLLHEGVLHRGADGWPLSWSWESGDRAEFLRVVTRFTSDRAEFFGTLLTPLVDGVRTADGRPAPTG